MNRKFPISLQHDAMLCGIACLQMVCDFYGKNYTSKHLSKLCSVTTEGVSLFSIDETAKILGFHTSQNLDAQRSVIKDKLLPLLM